MSQKKKAQKTVVKKKTKMDTATKIIIAGLIIIAIPFLVLGMILLSDSMKTGTPITGDRFKNDLDPAITTEDLNQIESSLSALNGVEEVETVLKTATLRIYLDTEDSKDAESLKALAEEAYQKVTSILSESVYFSQHDNMKMYDLEIHAYNLKENRDSEAFSYVIASKSSSMDQFMVQVVSEAKDPELAQQLREEAEAKNNPTPTPDDSEMTVGGQEQETTEENTEDGEE